MNFIQSKKILDIYKKVCSGKNELYPDLIKDENDDIIWDSSKRDFKYKNIIDEIRKARKKYQMKKGCSN